jgi:hypothetical protein
MSTCLLKLLLSAVTAENESVVISGTIFCVPVSKKCASCQLSYVLYCKTPETPRKAIQNNIWCNVLPLHCPSTYSCIHCCIISSCLTTLLMVLISLQGTTMHLLNWWTGCDHSTSAVMRSWWNVSKHGWSHNLLTSLTWAYKNLFTNTTRDSILAVARLRNSWSMYVCILFIYSETMICCSHIVLLDPLINFWGPWTNPVL